MPRVRANGEGTVCRLKRNGEYVGWRAVLRLGVDESTGQAIRKEFTSKTRKGVVEKMEAYKAQMNMEVLPSKENMTFKDLYHTWLFDYRVNDLKPKSFEKYEGIYRNYIKDSELGRVKLKDLRADHIQKYYNRLTNKNIMGDNVVPCSTINTIHLRINTCLVFAKKNNYIRENYASLVTKPKDNKIKNISDNNYEDDIKDSKMILTKEEQKQFIEFINGHKLETFFLVALGTGMRLGELIGLKWNDIDLDKGIITVRRSLQRIKDENGKGYIYVEQTPKTKYSIRQIPIPSNVLKKLKIYKNNQDFNKERFGNEYIDKNFVFTNDIGEHIKVNTPGKSLNTILKKLSIDHIKFHGLRHTYASRLLELNESPKTVQKLLGHHDIKVTLNTYSHILEDTKVNAVNKLDTLF